MNIRYLAAAEVVLCSALLGVAWIPSSAFIPPDSQKQSRFLRTYNPVPLLNSLRAACTSPGGTGTSSSSSAGFLFFTVARNVRFTRTVEAELCGHYQSLSMLTALNQSLLSALGASGCQISSDELSAGQGARIAYRCGARTAGLVTVTPPTRRPQESDGPAFLTLRFDEQWDVRTRV
jgi:hypothetical protein